MVIVHGCGEVKVVDSESTLATVDPFNEVVVLDTAVGNPETLECLKIEEVVSTTQVVLSEADQKVFENALKAHLAPLNYPVKTDCDNSIQLIVGEYRVRDLVVASRLAIDVNGSILNSDREQIWSAHYRLTENAGSVPLDPISAGLGIASAMQNSSEDARHNGVYLAVRRLLRALPAHQGLIIPEISPEPPKQVPIVAKTEKPKTLTDALNLWNKKNYGDALEIMEGLYSENSRSDIGYQFGLMLEATEDFKRAARIFADTAVAQAQRRRPEDALRTLRRLQRLNEVNHRQHDQELNRAVRMISDLMQN